jgi:hypothetical protein
MIKAAVIFLILGLSAGLWLGFNPQAHQQTIQKWDSAKSAYLQTEAKTTVQIQDLNSHLTSSFRTHPQTSPTPPSQPPVSSAWRQITTSSQSLWNSMQRIWANVTVKINTTR